MGRLPTTSPIGPRSTPTLKQADSEFESICGERLNADPDFSRKLTAARGQFEVARSLRSAFKPMRRVTEIVIKATLRSRAWASISRRHVRPACLA